MLLRRLVTIGAIVAAAVGTMSLVPASATGIGQITVKDQSLRALGMRHGLYLGTAVDMAAVDDPADAPYHTILSREFSTVTAENAMKWESLEPTRGVYDWTVADRFVELARKNNQQVRGHVLVWNNQLPKWLTEGVENGTISNDELRGLLKKHITDVANHFRGKIWQWDVVNEAVTDPWDTPAEIHYKGFWAEHLGSGYVADAFRWARAADPGALLFYNDYNIDAFGDGSATDKTMFVYNMVKALRAGGVPIDGVGSQGHLGTQYGNFDALQIADALDRFSGLGVATAITEADVRSEMTDAVTAGTSEEINPRLQASAANFSALMQGCLASRHCLSFTVWGFTDKHSWIPDFYKGKQGLATLYDEQYQPKRAYNTLRADLAYAGGPMVGPRIPQPPMPLVAPGPVHPHK